MQPNQIRMKIMMAVGVFLLAASNSFSQKIGIFTGHTDVGEILHPGTTTYNSGSDTYEISGSGANIWFTHDDFQYAWKKIKGDFIIQARGRFIGKGVEEHRKFGLMARANLDSTSAMVAATVHGSGLTSLQYRKIPKTNVEEKQFSISGPNEIQLERRGNLYIMSVAHFGDTFVTEEIMDVDLGEDVYVGLFICAHNKDVIEKATFDNVRIYIPAGKDLVPYRSYLGSHIETMEVFTGHRKIVYSENVSLQAPNWTLDGKSLIYNSNGSLYRFDLKTRKPTLINTGNLKDINNDHVISFNGKMLGISALSPDGKIGSVVYTMPISGGQPKLITLLLGFSYLHGWSPDGKWLTFTGKRNNDPTPAGFDIYKIPSNGGKEIQLTSASGLDDGPEYSPDGKYIYFNSVRSGLMQLWRMKPDGSGQEQVTNDNYNNWFPHISPDGKWIVCISFAKDEVKPDDHPFYKHVYLRMMPVSGGPLKVIAYLYGGQGTINTPSWSPDSKKIAFVSNTDMSE
ncbi:MAG TPA: biopolymer transporter TolR [Hanamia sp.]|nr:biopolymer transporter TolR [Hanamia sp.]